MVGPTGGPTAAAVEAQIRYDLLVIMNRRQTNAMPGRGKSLHRARGGRTCCSRRWQGWHGEAARERTREETLLEGARVWKPGRAFVCNLARPPSSFGRGVLVVFGYKRSLSMARIYYYLELVPPRRSQRNFEVAAVAPAAAAAPAPAAGSQDTLRLLVRQKAAAATAARLERQ